MNAIQLERTLYRNLVDNSRSRFGHEAWLRKMAAYRKRPAHFALRVLGSQWWSAQEQVGNAILNHRRVVVRSGNGVGKTYLAADLALWFLYTHRPAVVITTAPTWRQVKQLLWHEIHKRHYGARNKLIGRVLQTKIELGKDSFAVGLSTGKGVQFQGFHCANLLIIMDEASGIPDEIWDAAEGVAVGINNKILAIGNPLTATGRFYQLFRGSAGWSKVTISALEHPNVTGLGKTIPGCVTRGFVEEKVEDWCEPVSVGGRGLGVGENQDRPTLENLEAQEATEVSPLTTPNPQPLTPDVFVWRGRPYRPNDLFRARVLGEFPGCAENALIPLRWVEAAQTRSLPAVGIKRVAADVARFGDDWTIIGMRVGPVVVSIEALEFTRTTEVSGRLVQLAYSEHPDTIAVDAIGLGAGVVDELFEQNIDGVEPVNVSLPAHDREHYANRRAELFWGLRERFRVGDISFQAQLQIDDYKEQINLLTEELSSIRYKINSRGQIQIETKEEMKRRVKRSPDRADMLAMLFDGSGEALASRTVERAIEPSRTARLREEMRGW